MLGVFFSSASKFAVSHRSFYIFLARIFCGAYFATYDFYCARKWNLYVPMFPYPSGFPRCWSSLPLMFTLQHRIFYSPFYWYVVYVKPGLRIITLNWVEISGKSF